MTSDPWHDRTPLWRQEAVADHPELPGDLEVDVVVIGAGIAGLTAADELSRAGHLVAVLESRSVGSGATGSTTAKVTSLHGAIYRSLTQRHGPSAAAAYAAGNESARSWIEERVATLGVECDLEHRPAVTYARNAGQRATIIEEHAAAAAAGLPVHLENTFDLPFEIEAAVVLEEGQFQFNPVPYLDALAGAVTASGGEVYEQSRAVGLTSNGDRPVVVTEHGRVTAQHVLVCTAIPFLDRALFFSRLEPLRSYAVAVEVDTPLPLSMSISVDDPVRSLRTARASDGAELLLVGGGGHPVGRGGDTRRRQDELVAWLEQHFGPCHVHSGWSAQDYATLDGLPYVGRARGVPNGALVATGFAKWGMTNGTLAARVLADAVLGRAPAPWAPMLDARRLDLVHSARRFVGLNGEVIGRMVAGHMSSALAVGCPPEGEGAVARGTAVATIDGAPCAVSGICPHLGGVLAWNPLERSWDCPLHGSRFGADGRLLQGPAVEDLASRAST